MSKQNSRKSSNTSHILFNYLYSSRHVHLTYRLRCSLRLRNGASHPAPISKNVVISRTTNDTAVDGTDAIMAVLTTLKGQTDSILPQIGEQLFPLDIPYKITFSIDTLVASGKRTDENDDALFDELISALTAAQESLTSIDAQGIASTDNLNEAGAVIADTIKVPLLSVSSLDVRSISHINRASAPLLTHPQYPCR